MTVVDTLERVERVAEKLRRRQQKKTDEFEALVRAFVDGAVDDDYAAERLEAAGKSIEDLQQSVAYRARRLELAAALPATRDKLVVSYRGPLRDELAQLAEKRRQLFARLGPLEQSREHHAIWSLAATEFAGKRQYHNASEEEIERHKALVIDIDKQLAELRAQLAPLDARERDIENEMAKP